MQTADDGGVQGVCGDGRMKAIGMPILAGDGVLDEMRWAVEGCDSFSSGSLWWDGWEGCVRFDYVKLQQTDFCCWGRCLWGGSRKKSEGGGSRRPYVNVSGEDVRRAQLRRECRGLVMSSGGVVLVRPVPKTFMRGQVLDMRHEQLKGQRVQEVTEKLDGQLVVGVVNGNDEVEMWSRSGRTEVGRSAMMCAMRSDGQYVDMIRKVEARGSTACFEYVGRQSRVKVKYDGMSEVVLVAVRDKVTGRYWRYDDMMQLGEECGVRVVRRVCVGVREVREVEEWLCENGEGMEGVMVRFSGGVVVKVKTEEWLRRKHVVQGWRKGVELDGVMRKNVMRYGDDRRVRLVVKGWSMRDPPVKVMSVLTEAVKVEACYDRATGGRGSIVVSFSSREAADRAREGQWHGLELSRAYSSRCKSSALVKVLRWWREKTVLEGVVGKRARMSYDSDG